jgi:hypothetical protein
MDDNMLMEKLLDNTADLLLRRFRRMRGRCLYRCTVRLPGAHRHHHLDHLVHLVVLVAQVENDVANDMEAL